MPNPIQKPANAWQWIDARKRQGGTWAFSLNRLTALGLTLYLYIHLVVLGKLAQGPQAYDEFIEFAKSPLIIIGELLVIFAGIYHGLNGLRLALTSFGIAVPYQKQLFYGLLAVSIVLTILFAVRLFTI